MISFDTWLTQIIRYCNLIVDRTVLSKAWIDQDVSKTSVTDFDELYEQVFDDLDSDTFETELTSYLPTDASGCAVLREFLGAIRHIDRSRDRNIALRDTPTLLCSAEWHGLEISASRVIATFGGRKL